MQATKFIPLIILVCSLGFAGCAKILAVYSTYSKSHLIYAQNLLKELAKRDHEVTVVSAFPLDNPPANYNDVYVEMPAALRSHMNDRVATAKSTLESLSTLNVFPTLALQFGNDTINSPIFQKMMAEDTYDLVILPFMINDFHSGIAAHFKCPLIVICPIGNIHTFNTMIGNPSSLASTPSIFLNYPTPMSFWQRLKNFGMAVLETVIYQAFLYQSAKFYDFNFPSGKYPPFNKARRSIDLMLINHHFSEGIVRPTVPGLIDVAGLQIKPQPDPLPSGMQTWIDGADHGVILFSLGSNVKSTSMSKEKLAAILNVFATLKQRVLFKWETDNLPNRPANVMISKWMPQDDVLAHQNVKLFITHGGMGSVAEAKFHGVPIIGIPFYGDQSANVAVAVQEGWAIHIEFAELSEGQLKAAIDEILSSPSYRAEVKATADLYRDRPQNALDTAVFWVEYVIRHKGAAHMRSPLLDMNFLEQNSVDVLAFLGLAAYIVCKLLSFVVKSAWKLLKRKNKNTKTS